MTRQRTRTVRVRGAVAAVAVAVMALHVVAGATAHHGHEEGHEESEEEEACSVCALFSSEDDAVQPQAAGCLAARRAEPGAVALPTPPTASNPLPYLPRGPPKLCR